MSYSIGQSLERISDGKIFRIVAIGGLNHTFIQGPTRKAGLDYKLESDDGERDNTDDDDGLLASPKRFRLATRI